MTVSRTNEAERLTADDLQSSTTDWLREFDHTDARYGNAVDDTNTVLRACPVAHSDPHDGFWILSRYHDVVAALCNHGTFSSAAGHTIPHGAHSLRTIPAETDEPLHGHYRQVLWPHLTPHAVAEFEPVVRSTASALLDEAVDRGRMEVLNDYARPIPARVTGKFFGMSSDEGEQCYEWIQTFISENVSDPEAAHNAVTEFLSFLRQTIAEARRSEQQTVIRAITSAEVDGRPLSEEEILGMLLGSIAGALETTVGALGQGVNLLARHPEQRARLVADPSLIPQAVEEILRIDPPAFAPARTAIAPAEVGGANLQAGERVLLLFRSANHDETVFEDPEAFKVDRPNNRHLTFGYGIHKCTGQHLARLELKVAFEELLRRIPDFEVEGDPQPHVRGGQTWGLSDLTIRWK